MCRYVRRHRRYYLFWFSIATLTCLLLYMTNNAIFNHGFTNYAQPIDTQLLKIVARGSPTSDEHFPELPIQPPTHAERPIIAHYLWCGQRLFEFRHYLSLKSVDSVVQPYKILFHYVELPLVDTEQYFVWFNQTLAEVPDIVLNKLDRSTCPTSGALRYMLILDLLFKYGGVYVPDDVILFNFPHELRTVPFATNVVTVSPDDYHDGVIVARANATDIPQDAQHVFLRLSGKNELTIPSCIDHSTFERTSNRRVMCLFVDTMLFPKDIWNSNSKFAIFARTVAYERTDIQPKNDLRTPFPKIVHYICVSGCEIEFITYISILSSLFVAKLDRVYIHGTLHPSGQWWTRLQDEARVVFVEHQSMIFDGDNIHSTTRDPCPLRLEILLRYGGIYIDGNVLWTQRIPDHYFGYEAVVSPDWHLYGSWPDSVNPSIIMGKESSSYLIKLNRIIQSRTDVPIWFNDHFSSYQILEFHPESAFLDRRLQVKCLNHNCHPTWLQEYRSELHQNKPGNAFDWRSETLSVHWVDSLPTFDVDMVKYLSGIPVEIARHVFEAASVDVNSL